MNLLLPAWFLCEHFGLRVISFLSLSPPAPLNWPLPVIQTSTEKRSSDINEEPALTVMKINLEIFIPRCLYNRLRTACAPVRFTSAENATQTNYAEQKTVAQIPPSVSSRALRW